MRMRHRGKYLGQRGGSAAKQRETFLGRSGEKVLTLLSRHRQRRSCRKKRLSHSLNSYQVFSPQAVPVIPIALAFFRSSGGGIANALQAPVVKALNDHVSPQVEPMSAVAANSAVLPVPGFPERVEVHWETQRRNVWNARVHKSEERELVYEISWIAELGLWRSFLRSQREVKS